MEDNTTASQQLDLMWELATNVINLQGELRTKETELEQCEASIRRHDQAIAKIQQYGDRLQKRLDALNESAEEQRRHLQDQLALRSKLYENAKQRKEEVLRRQDEAQRLYKAMKWQLVKDTVRLNNFVWRFRVPVRTEEELTRFLASGELAEQHFGKVLQGEIPKNLASRPDYERIRDFGLFLPPEEMAELKKAAEEVRPRLKS